jgi:hypothetical protein
MMNTPVPSWTPEMQRLWNRAMLMERTRGAYGCAFPVPGTSYRPPVPGTMLHTILFAALATDEEYEDLLTRMRENMLEWKARVRASGNKRRETITDVSGIDISSLEIKL